MGGECRQFLYIPGDIYITKPEQGNLDKECKNLLADVRKSKKYYE